MFIIIMIIIIWYCWYYSTTTIIISLFFRGYSLRLNSHTRNEWTKGQWKWEQYRDICINGNHRIVFHNMCYLIVSQNVICLLNRVIIEFQRRHHAITFSGALLSVRCLHHFLALSFECWLDLSTGKPSRTKWCIIKMSFLSRRKGKKKNKQISLKKIQE